MEKLQSSVLRAEDGSSLLELLFYMSILVLFFICILPLNRWLKRAEFDFVTARFAAEIRLLQDESWSKQLAYQKFPGIEGEPMGHFAFDRISGQECYFIAYRASERKRCHSYPSSIRISCPRFEFSKMGELNPPLTIWLFQGQEIRTIIIDKVGRIRVERR